MACLRDSWPTSLPASRPHRNPSRVLRPESVSEDGLSAIAPAPGYLAEAELADKVLCGPSGHAELGRDHACRHQRPREHKIDQRRQLGVFSAPGELAFEQTVGKEPSIMVLEALPGPQRNGIKKDYQSCW